MINGKEYGWEDLNIFFPGKAEPIAGVTAVEYSTKKEHINIYGRGDKPVAIGKGKKEFSGSITFLQSEIEALQRTLGPGQDLTDLPPFIVGLEYADEVITGVTVDQLFYCRITEIKKELKTGDPNMEVTLPLAIGDIKYNA